MQFFEFAVGYLRSTWKELRWHWLILASALFVGIAARANFDVVMTLAAIPFAIIVAFVLIFFLQLTTWGMLTRAEARKRGTSFGNFLTTPEYGRFLAEKAAAVLRRERKGS